MTRPHPTVAELLAHARRTSPPAEVLEVSEHLAACAACRTTLGQLTPAGPREAVVRPGLSPGADYETLTGYLDGTLDPVDREILEADLRNHPELAAQLADLRRQRAEVEPAAANVLPFPGSGRRTFLLRVAAAAAVLLVVAGLTWRLAAPRPPALTLRDDGREGGVRALTEFPDIPPDLQVAVREAARTGQVPLPADWPALRGERGTLLAEAPAAGPGTTSFTLLAPVGVSVRGLQPVLRWTARAGAAAYRITLLELPDGEVSSSPVLPAPTNTWQPDRALAAGKRYTWQVQALDPDGNVLEKAPAPPQPETRFQTLTAAQESELHRLESAHPQAHLLLAVADARLGLLPEAAAHLQRLATANPGEELPGVLLRRLQTAQTADQSSATAAPTATNGAQ